MTEHNTNVVIASPNQENSAVLNTRIEETVQMSTYQIKKKLEMDIKDSREEYANLGKVRDALGEISSKICNRIYHEMENLLIDKACLLLGEMDDYIEIGAEDTYFDDNREADVDRRDIAKNLVEVSFPSISKSDIEYQGKAFAHGSINLFGNTSDRYDRFEEEECVFSPKKICKQFPLRDEEIEHYRDVFKIVGTRTKINLRINELEKKLKNLGSLTEDIRYAMLAEKAKASQDTTSIDLAAQIADAYVSGTDPSTLLLGN